MDCFALGKAVSGLHQLIGGDIKFQEPFFLIERFISQVSFCLLLALAVRVTPGTPVVNAAWCF
jgi:hypothetical protein